MSSIYIREPPTHGKVVIRTTFGDIDIELWPKEAPLACRNFAQLCVEGYYDDTIFHRLIKEMMIQGGDPTGTGTGGNSIWDKPFKNEIHSRLKFSHRGIVAMANGNKPDSNGSQFFMTLAPCDWLDGKHTIFGKVTGNTIFNLLNVNNIDTDEKDRPIAVPPPRIKTTEVLVMPFENIVPRMIQRRKTKKELEEEKRKDEQRRKKKRQKKRLGKKNLSLLSFGDEEAVNAEVLDKKKRKKKTTPIQSTANVDNDVDTVGRTNESFAEKMRNKIRSRAAVLLRKKEKQDNTEKLLKEEKKKNEMKPPKTKKKEKKKKKRRKSSSLHSDAIDEKSKQLLREMKKRRREMKHFASELHKIREKEKKTESVLSESNEKLKTKKRLQPKDSGPSTSNPTEKTTKKKKKERKRRRVEDGSSLIEQQRQAFLKKKGVKKSTNHLKRLEAFTTKIRKANSSSKSESSWLSNELLFSRHWEDRQKLGYAIGGGENPPSEKKRKRKRNNSRQNF
eukprot:g1754.t1